MTPTPCQPPKSHPSSAEAQPPAEVAVLSRLPPASHGKGQLGHPFRVSATRLWPASPWPTCSQGGDPRLWIPAALGHRARRREPGGCLLRPLHSPAGLGVRLPALALFWPLCEKGQGRRACARPGPCDLHLGARNHWQPVVASPRPPAAPGGRFAPCRARDAWAALPKRREAQTRHCEAARPLSLGTAPPCPDPEGVPGAESWGSRV